MADASSEPNPVDQLAEEFLQRYRHGDRPALSEYTERYPHYAEAIRQLFPALVKMEQLKPDIGDATGPFAPAGSLAAEPKLDRLGDYHILREVGRGGMGIVYEAEQESLGRHVALKVLPSHALLDPKQLQRFQREARAAARLHHTNIVPVYGVGADASLHYYVMQFIPGQGLDAVLAEVRRLRQAKQSLAEVESPAAASGRGPGVSVSVVAQGLLTGHFAAAPPDSAPAAALVRTSAHTPRGPVAEPPASPAGTNIRVQQDSAVHLPGQSEGSTLSGSGLPYWHSVARIGIQVAEALAYANSQGVLHRDIKPSNLLLDTQGNVWVTDFGLAKAVGSEDLTHTGDIVGTMRYLAPERFRGQADARSDVYALGLTLYELLTLRPAFDESERDKLVAQVMQAEPPRPRQVAADVPRDLETVVLKAMERDPARRYQAAQELADDLKRYVAGEPIQARRVSAWQRTVLWARRRPTAAALVLVSSVAVLALLVASTVTLLSVRLRQEKERAEDAKQAESQAREKAEQAQRDETQARKEAEQAQRAEAQARQGAEQYRYLQHLALAAAELRNNSMVRVEQLLDACPSDYQHNWEWRYLKQQCHRDLLTLRGHDGGVFGLAFSPDGARLATASFDGLVKVWEVSTGQVLYTLTGHHSEVAHVRFSPDGRRLASAGWQDDMVKVWDARTGQELRTFSQDGWHWDIAFSPEGRRLAVASGDGTVKVWDVTTGQDILSLNAHRVAARSVAFSPDGRWLVSAGWDQLVKIWDATTGQEIRTLKGHTLGVDAVAFSPDGTRLASAGEDRTVKLWDPATGQLLHTLYGHTLLVFDLAFSPDGSQVASASADQTVRVWDARTGQEISTLQGHGNIVFSVAFSPDGTRLASGSQDRTVKLWDVTQSQRATTLRGHQAPVQGVAFSPPDGALLASASADGTAKIWDWKTSQVVHTLKEHNGPVLSVAFSPNGAWLATASADKTAKVWEVSTGQLLHTLKGHTKEVVSVAFSPDGTLLATASHDHSVRVWDALTGRVLHTLRSHQNVVRSVSFSSDGSRLASSSGDLHMNIWNPTTGELVRTLEGGRCWIHSVAFSPEGGKLASRQGEEALDGPGRSRSGTRLALGSGDGSVQLWNPFTGQCDYTIPAHGGFVNCVAFSPDGTRLASASLDEVIKLWDVATGQEVLSLHGHSGGVNGVAFSPDGIRFASAGADGTVKIWDAQAVSALERETLGLVEFLFARPLCRADVLDYLRTAKTIRPEVRTRALALAEHHRDKTDREAYRLASWNMARQRYLNTFQYHFALLQAETACRLAPEQGAARTTLGMAQYRAEKLQQAAETLQRADQLNQGVPANLAFLALAQYRLEKKEDAQATLARLRACLKTPQGAKDETAQAFLHEAEALIEGTTAGAAK
jgi:WD40 repeat protein